MFCKQSWSLELWGWNFLSLPTLSRLLNVVLFYLLSNSPYYVASTVWFTVHSVKDLVGVTSFRILWTKLLQILMCRLLCDLYLDFSGTDAQQCDCWVLSWWFVWFCNNLDMLGLLVLLTLKTAIRVMHFPASLPDCCILLFFFSAILISKQWCFILALKSFLNG